jgi:crotonobetainyl-CoA:carnitine CoA-transferase CaiB-like acyl-CoA transferase
MKFDTSLLGSQISLQSFDITSTLFTGKLRPRSERGGSRPFWRLYRAGDGKWFVIGMLLDRAWEDVCRVIERTDLLDDPRFDTFRKRIGDNARDLIAILDERFATAPARHWVDALNAAGMYAQPVQDYAEVDADPQVHANAYIHEVEYPGHDPVRIAGSGIAVDGEPLRVTHLAPHHGEHTEEVLLEAGYTWDDIDRLRRHAVIGPAHRPSDGADG